MIVDPDFCDHWKTRMLVDALDGDEAAVAYVIRLWAHCQNRRQWQFEDLSAPALKALCRFPGHANKLDASLSASGFIRRDENTLIVCSWDEYNSSLIAAWENGKRGGRPPNKKPKHNPDETDRSREDKNKEIPKKESCSEPPKTEASEPVMVFPTSGPTATWGLVQSKIEEYAATYPGLDVVAECRKARQWAIDNKLKRKTAAGMPRFLGTWMSEAQNRSGGKSNGNSSGKPSERSRFQSSIDALERFATGDESGVCEGNGPSVRLETND